MVKVRHREPAKSADRPGPKWHAGRLVDCSRRRRWHRDPPDYRTQPPHPRLHIGQQGKPHSSRREAVSRPQGRGMTVGVEESRRKRMLSCNGADRACESGKYPTRKGADFPRVSAEAERRSGNSRWRSETMLGIERTNGRDHKWKRMS